MRTRRYLVPALGSAAAVLMVTTAGQAQPKAEGFALDRFEPSERGSDWFAAESLDFRGHQRFAAGLVGDYSYKPLVIYRPDGEERSAIVAHRLNSHLGGAVTLWDRVKLAVNLPIALYQQGDGGTTSYATFETASATAVGDLRIGGDVRILGGYAEPVTVAAGLQLFAPTGSRDSYTSDGSVRVYPRVLVAGQVTNFVYAARLGVNVRAMNDDFANSPTGTEISAAAAAGVRVLDDKLVVGPELFTSTVVTDGDAFFARRTTPVEVLVGGHYMATDVWRFGAGVGPGLSRAFGTPKVRALLSVEWVEPSEKKPVAEPPRDRDGDGIPDVEDACPDQPGVRTSDPKTNGCPPPPSDRDGDGIPDVEDACPDQPGVRTSDPKTNGCPPPPADRDGDGIPDAEDACPDQPGVKTEDPKTNGCPPPSDRDGDGILDGEDACPDVAGPRNDDPKKNGCPVARIESGEIKIREQVQFAYNSAQILKQSDFILEAVLEVLKNNPQIQKVDVQGHTDSKGGDAFNKNLSRRRAKSVVDWLVKHGIAQARLSPSGFGEEKPIDSNDTEEGRANNRRVEFHILDAAGGAVK